MANYNFIVDNNCPEIKIMCWSINCHTCNLFQHRFVNLLRRIIPDGSSLHQKFPELAGVWIKRFIKQFWFNLIPCDCLFRANRNALGARTANFAVNTAELAYSVPAFNESDANDGSIDNSVPMTITISGDTFTGTDGDDLVVENKVFVANLPAGLSAVITKTNVTVLTVTLTGNATSHLNTDSIGDLTLVFADNAFVSDDASGVTYSSKSDIAINFYDYTITASAGAGGSISPSGITPINNGASQLFAISANAGYHILDVVVDRAKAKTGGLAVFLEVPDDTGR